VHNPATAKRDAGATRELSPNVVALGYVSMLTAMSSAMIYGLLPVFLLKVIGLSMASIGIIEGMAEAANSFVKILSGAASDWIGRRKPLVVFGYAISALVKILYPLANTAFPVLVARVIDRLGKGIRDAPRDAFLADLIAPEVRGTGFGLRLALAIAGFVLGPLIAIGLMWLSGDDFRLVFWIALIPAYVSVVVLVVAVKELPFTRDTVERRVPLRRSELAALPAAFWWTIAIAGLLSLARFSQAFLVLKAHDTGVDAAFVPIVLVVMHLVYSLTAYPFGVLADRIDRRRQLALGTVILIAADLVLASATSVAWVVVGAALWGLQFGATQGLLGASIADAAPERLRGTAFGLYDIAIGLATFLASAGAGAIWMAGGPATVFALGGCVAAGAVVLLLLQPPTVRAAQSAQRPQNR
jgi:MFS family permease